VFLLFRNVVGRLFVSQDFILLTVPNVRLNLVKGLLCPLRHRLGTPHKILLNWKNLSPIGIFKSLMEGF
jgi:hypothetical protein